MGGGKKPATAAHTKHGAAPQLLGSAAKAAAAATTTSSSGQPQQQRPTASNTTAQQQPPPAASAPARDEGDPSTAATSEPAGDASTPASRPGEGALAPPPVPEDADADLRDSSRRMRYDCRKCRQALLTTDDVVPHSDDSSVSGHKGFTSKKYALQQLMSACSSIFVDPEKVSWVEAQTADGGNGGDIVCPAARCGAKLGSWSWIGAQCSCGQWVSPAFKIVVSKLDAVAVPDDEANERPAATAAAATA